MSVSIPGFLSEIPITRVFNNLVAYVTQNTTCVVYNFYSLLHGLFNTFNSCGFIQFYVALECTHCTLNLDLCRSILVDINL